MTTTTPEWVTLARALHDEHGTDTWSVADAAGTAARLGVTCGVPDPTGPTAFAAWSRALLYVEGEWRRELGGSTRYAFSRHANTIPDPFRFAVIRVGVTA